MQENVVEDYGTRTGTPPCSCSFIAPKVIQVLKQLGCDSVLDVGCGNGALCGIMQKAGFTVAGADYDAHGVEIAQKTYPDVRFCKASVYEDPDVLAEWVGKRVDCVVSTEVAEHLFDPQSLPRFASRLMQPDGYLIVSTPYHGYLKNLLLALVDHWDAHHSPLWKGGHIKFWSRKTLTLLLEHNGFEVLHFHGVGRLPFLWKSMILVARKKG